MFAIPPKIMLLVTAVIQDYTAATDLWQSWSPNYKRTASRRAKYPLGGFRIGTFRISLLIPAPWRHKKPSPNTTVVPNEGLPITCPLFLPRQPVFISLAPTGSL